MLNQINSQIDFERIFGKQLQNLNSIQAVSDIYRITDNKKFTAHLIESKNFNDYINNNNKLMEIIEIQKRDENLFFSEIFSIYSWNLPNKSLFLTVIVTENIGTNFNELISTVSINFLDEIYDYMVKIFNALVFLERNGILQFFNPIPSNISLLSNGLIKLKLGKHY